MARLLVSTVLVANLGLQGMPDEGRARRLPLAAHPVDQLEKPIVNCHLDGFHDCGAHCGVITCWIESGTANAVLSGEYARIGADEFDVSLELPPHWPRVGFVARLRTADIGAVSSDAVAISAPVEAVRLGLGVPASSQERAAGLKRVATLMGEIPAMSSMGV